jgi:hypothetical protein
MKTGVRVTFDPEGSADDSFNYDTGGVYKPLNDDELVYDELSIGDGGRSLAHFSGLGGKAIVAPISAVRSTGLQIADGARFTNAPYEIHVPLDAPDAVGINAVVEVVASEFPYSDPALLERQFIIRVQLDGTLSPVRVYIAEERTRGQV